ncbi:MULTISPECIES: hypothetical protein [Pseudomonas]|uniref:hypothetical protein n=1 Tax=Pseudomonas TaxID=286 RepID=UPI000F470B00|nr:MULTISPECIES: hypothetical protein [Pseudomonas]MCO7578617.1 hypothetical protein [Pseudomonas protegens]MCO7585393.1 hypothetical protein [Pseudomonas chlororaphis]MCO7601815.1 hypothetical protein [Pseudomonas chlororaphis]NMY72413.1 hypothetical protein [Pseudomonas sp. WS 5414]ROL92284.1 hypothetical protein BK639_17715 [Pseudomonas protegens]
MNPGKVHRRLQALMLGLCWSVTQVQAEAEQGLSAKIALKRYFFSSSPAEGVDDGQLSGTAQLGLDYQYLQSWDSLRLRLVVNPRYLESGSGDPRPSFYWDELFVLLEQDNRELKVGRIKEHWGVMETRQLVDVINTYDNLDGLQPEEKLSQKAIKLGSTLGPGHLSLYLLDGFEPVQFYSEPARFAAYRVQPAAEYIHGADPDSLDLAARYFVSVADLDIGLSYFKGTNRSPALRAEGDSLVAQYTEVTQWGLDAIWVREQWLYKLEALDQRVSDNAYSSRKLSVGLEYAITRAWRDADLSLIGEYHHDRDQPLAPVSIFDRKFLLGARLELNDAHLSSVFLGYTAQASDLRNNMLSASLDLGLSDAVRAGVSAALINSSASDVVWDALASDSHVALELSYSF